MAVIDPVELEESLALTFTRAERDRAAVVLDDVLALLQGECTAVRLPPAAEATIILEGTWGHRLRLPAGPVTEISAVSVNDQPLTVDVDWWWPGGTVIHRGPRPTATATPTQGRHWGGPDSFVEVTHTRGYTSLPADLRAVALKVAGRAMTTTPGVRSETIGSYQVTYDTDTPPLTLTPSERRACRRYRVTTYPRRGDVT